MINNRKGLFIVFDGIDGCGKSTAIENSKKYLEEKGMDVVLIREPGTTDISEQIREVILSSKNKDMNVTTETLLFTAARADLVQKVILPALEENKIVLCDRYVYSTFVYQGYVKRLNLSYISNIHDHFPVPDITLIFNVDYREAINRLKYRAEHAGENNRFDNESEEFFKRSQKGFSTINKLNSKFIKDTNLLFINTTELYPQETFEKVKSAILDDIIYKIKR